MQRWEKFIHSRLGLRLLHGAASAGSVGRFSRVIKFIFDPIILTRLGAKPIRRLTKRCLDVLQHGAATSDQDPQTPARSKPMGKTHGRYCDHGRARTPSPKLRGILLNANSPRSAAPQRERRKRCRASHRKARRVDITGLGAVESPVQGLALPKSIESGAISASPGASSGPQGGQVQWDVR